MSVCVRMSSLFPVSASFLVALVMYGFVNDIFGLPGALSKDKKIYFDDTHTLSLASQVFVIMFVIALLNPNVHSVGWLVGLSGMIS